MKKISILHLSQVSGGGVEKYIKLFLKYSNNEKFDNYLVAPNLDNYKEYKIKKSFEFNTNQSFSIIQLLKNVLFIRNIFKEIKPDIVYLHSTFAGVIGRLAAVGCNCKVVYNPHSWSFKMDISSIKKLFYKSIEFFLSFFTDKYILISKSEYELAKNICFNNRKLEIIYNGIEINERYNEIKELSDSLSGMYVIGMVGRICEQKNPLFFVEFAKELYKLRKDIFFIIVGDGELKKEIENKIVEYGMEDHFLITGWVNNPKDYIELFDQAVLFSKWEGLCLSIAEYMLARKPILATDIGGINDLIQNNVTGLLINNFNLNDAVISSLKIRENEKLSYNISKNAYDLVIKKFSIDKQMGNIENLFFNMLEKENG